MTKGFVQHLRSETPFRHERGLEHLTFRGGVISEALGPSLDCCAIDEVPDTTLKKKEIMNC